MGAWGTAIFSDDTALDVRDSYRELLEDGVAAEEATKTVIQSSREIIDDEDDGPVFWLALAATQWKLGRLEDHVKEQALRVIDSGAGLARWEEEGPKLLVQRRAVMTKLKDQLLSPQPPAKKVKKRFRFYIPDMQTGDAFSFRLDSGKIVILRVAGIEQDRYGPCLCVELCDWIGDTPPPPKQIERLPAIVEEWGLEGLRFSTVVQTKKNDYPAEKIEVVARGLRIWDFSPSKVNSCGVWSGLSNSVNKLAPRLRPDPRPKRLFRARPRLLKRD